MLRLLSDEVTQGTNGVKASVLPPVAKEWSDWPDAVAYREAIQNPQTALGDTVFQRPTLALDRRGMPLAYTGRFAVVFRVADAAGQNWAVRCYTASPQSRGEDGAYRYNTLAPTLTAPDIRDLWVPFRYQAQGIAVGPRRFPVLAMQWGQGDALGRWVEKNLSNPAALLSLGKTLGTTLDRLTRARIAHGDWQHDNLLVADGGRKVTFVDYDGVYIDTLADCPPSERGHPNYNHPSRVGGDYGPEMDRFPCLLMQTALAFLAVEPTLYDSFCDGDNLLFHTSDLESPADSPVFAALRLVADKEPQLADLLTRFTIACETGIVGETVSGKVFDAIAKQHTLTLDDSQNAPEPVSSFRKVSLVDGSVPAPRPRGLHGALQAQVAPSAFAFNAAQAVPTAYSATPSRFSNETRVWFDNIKRTLKRQEVADRVHRTLMWLFLASVVAWLCVAVNGGGDAFAQIMLSWFVTPIGIAFGYFLWPRNQGWLEVMSVKTESDDKLAANLNALRTAVKRLNEINRQPANLSTVAFVASTLQGSLIHGGKVQYPTVGGKFAPWLVPLAQNALTFTPDELASLYGAGIHNLSDVNSQSVATLAPALEERLLATKQTLMQAAARDGYAEVAQERREWQQKAEELEQERAGLLEASDVLNRRLQRIGSISFGRFLGYLFGF